MIFTGHSLGGALATHAAMDIMLEEFISSQNIKLYTYGGPRVANPEWENVLASSMEAY